MSNYNCKIRDYTPIVLNMLLVAVQRWNLHYIKYINN